MAKKRIRFNFVRIALMIAFFSVAAYLLFNVYQDFSKNAELRRELSEAQDKLAVIEEENTTLMGQKEKLNDDAYVQSYARGNYMLSKDGEKVFYLPKTEK